MRVCVFGAGLIGGSIAKGLKKAGWSVMVYDQSEEVQKAAIEEDLPVVYLQDQLHDPDLLVIALPPEEIAEWAAKLLENYPRAVVTDTGSTKSLIDNAVREGANPEQIARWVPGHPLAGAPGRGFEASQADLFQGHSWVLCPSQDNMAALGVVKLMIHALGAKLMVVDPEEHDEMVAWSSHLTQVSSSALQRSISGELGSRLPLIAGSGLRDATRLADCDPWLWQQILLSNKGNLLPAIDSLQGELMELRELVEDGDPEALARWLSQGALDRQNLSQSRSW